LNTVAFREVKTNVVYFVNAFLSKLDGDVGVSLDTQKNLWVESPGGMIQTATGTLGPPFALNRST